jgi:hypothetical protein
MTHDGIRPNNRILGWLIITRWLWLSYYSSPWPHGIDWTPLHLYNRKPKTLPASMWLAKGYSFDGLHQYFKIWTLWNSETLLVSIISCYGMVNIHCSIPVWFIVEIPSRLQCLNCGKLLNKYPKANWFCFLLSLSRKAKIPRPNLRAWLWKTEILWIQGISTLVLRSLQLLAALSTGLTFFHLCLQFFICF